METTVEYLSINCCIIIKQLFYLAGRMCPHRIDYIINHIKPRLRQINARQFKMTTIFERFNTVVPYFMTFIFQVLCIISEKIGLGWAVLCLLFCTLPISSSLSSLSSSSSSSSSSKSKTLIFRL